MPLLETVDLSQKYGQRDILKRINLKVEKGEVFALIGATGAGKTTLLRLLDLLEMPSSGKIYFDGKDTAELGRMKLVVRRRIAFVLQKPVVFNTTVYDNIAYGLRWRGIIPSSIHEKVENVLEMVGLSAYRNRNARMLSGGETQKVAIARAIVTEPELLLLDELTANLDPVSAREIDDLIANIRHHYETTIVMATHDMAQGQRLADKVGVLRTGEMVQTGDWREVFYSPQDKEVARFVGVENILDGVIIANDNKMVSIDIGGKVVEAISDYAVGEIVSACLRPEDITVALAKISSSARNSFSGEITRLFPVGPLNRVEVDCGFTLVCLVTKRSAEELALAKGKMVYVTFKATAVHVLKREKIVTRPSKG